MNSDRLMPALRTDNEGRAWTVFCLESLTMTASRFSGRDRFYQNPRFYREANMSDIEKKSTAKAIDTQICGGASGVRN